MHTSIAKPSHVFNPSIVIGLNRLEAAASVQINFCKASACGSANGKVERSGETQERSRSETTVAVPQAEARGTFGACGCRS
jgi:hypothetical protein